MADELGNGGTPHRDRRPIAFVLGGGGIRGAVEVGMLQALFEAGIVPDVIVGTSIGAINGAIAASDPSPAVIGKLIDAWTSPAAQAVYGTSFGRRLRTLASSRTHINPPGPLRRLLSDALGEDATFEGLAVPLMVGAANIERAAEHWFDSGPLIDAVMASASVPGLLPPTHIAGEHYIDGGIVNSIPVEQAVLAGARTIYVLQVGRVEEPLSVPTNAFGTAKVAFEVARRHRYARDMTLIPEGVQVHVLPTGGAIEGDEKIGSYRRMGPTRRRIEQAHAASRQYLASFVDSR